MTPMNIRFFNNQLLSHITALTVAVLLSGNLHAVETLAISPLFGDHAILQSDKEIPVFGEAPAGSKILAQLGEEKKSTVADANGRWEVRFSPRLPSTDPVQLRVESGDQTITTQGILIGSVWLASGQSNMAWPLVKSDMADAPDSERSNPYIRLFRVETEAGPETLPPAQPIGTWKPTDRGTTAYFSALALAFASKVQKEKGVPVGIILSAVGGTGIQPWIPVKVFEEDSAYANAITFRGPAGFGMNRNSREDYQRDLAATETQVALAQDVIADEALAWHEPGQDLSEWKPVRMPTGLILAGASWLAASFDCPTDKTSSQATLNLGVAKGAFRAWLNGTELEAESKTDVSENLAPETLRFVIPEGLLQEGTNHLVLRLVGLGWMGLVQGELVPPQIGFGRDGWQDAISLSGTWKMRSEIEVKRPPQLSAYAGNLFQSGLAPLAPFALAGILWYQGESNAYQPDVYQDLFPKLITSWRALWNDPKLPFIFVQLPGYEVPNDEPGESSWAKIRAAQAEALHLNDTGMVVSIDLGDKNDIHPQRKRAVGERLAHLAISGASRSGPWPEKAAFNGDQIKIIFDSEQNPLRAIGDQTALQGFEVSFDGNTYMGTPARLGEGAVMITVPKNQTPLKVRYAWANWPQLSLEDATGLPAPPFEIPVSSETSN